MIGYMATTNIKCDDDKYEIGKIYGKKDKIYKCYRDLSFYRDFDDVLKNKKFIPSLIVFEVNTLDGEITENKEELESTKLKIIRKIPRKYWNNYLTNYKIGSKGIKVTFNDNKGFSWTKTYDVQGNELSYIDSNGYSWVETFDIMGNPVVYWDSKDNSWTKSYDEDGNVLTYSDSKGVMWSKRYDEDGNEITDD